MFSKGDPREFGHGRITQGFADWQKLIAFPWVLANIKEIKTEIQIISKYTKTSVKLLFPPCYVNSEPTKWSFLKTEFSEDTCMKISTKYPTLKGELPQSLPLVLSVIISGEWRPFWRDVYHVTIEKKRVNFNTSVKNKIHSETSGEDVKIHSETSGEDEL